jgi:RNase H-like domain found in reverse transcriptase
MFSKLIPRKSTGFEVGVTENPRWQAPILLYPESVEAKMVKVKLRRNPTVASSAEYEKSYMPWTGHTVEGYCKFRAMIDEYIEQAPLNNVNERVSAIPFLLSGTPLSNWQNVLAQLPDKDKWNNKIKKLISKSTMLTYPDFNKVFEVHTDASDYQLGLVTK